jgi:ABC-type uncharacterized transport system permease subunit
MPDLILYFSTAAAWLALSALALRGSRVAVAGAPASPRPDTRIEIVLVPLALVLHATLLYHSVLAADGLDLNVANAVSMLVWLTVLIYWLASLAFDGLSGMLGMMAPVAFIAAWLPALMPMHHIVNYGGDPLFVLHFAEEILADSLLSVEPAHALVSRAEE